MPEPFVLKALIAGIGVALMTGPLGCFVAWKRMAYFGDTIAHAALLGVASALLLQTNTQIGIIVVAAGITLLLFLIERRKQLAADTVLGLFAHGSLAIALVLIALSKSIVVDINGFLFGDILAVDNNDIMLIYGMAVVILGAIMHQWKNLIRMVIHADIAQVEGIKTERLKLLLMLAVALTVAVSIKIVGALLITSLLIIPAASMRYFASNPTQMAIGASIIGVLAVVVGLCISLRFDTPSGASVILAALALFVLAYVFGKFRSIMTGT
jgi:zinc transport system permease protein